MIIDRAIRSVITSASLWGDGVKSENAASFGLQYGNGGISHAGIAVSHETAMTMSAVYACVGLISEDIASMPADVYQRYPTGRYARPSTAWMMKPNPEMEWEDLVQQTIAGLLLDGNGYLLPIRNRRGEVVELWPVDPRDVDIRRSENGDLQYIVRRSPIAPTDIMHMRGLTLPGAVKGLSVVGAAKHAIGLGLGAEALGGKLFANGSALGVTLQTEQRLDPDSAEAIANRWTDAHAGIQNAHKVVVLDRGTKAERLSMTQEEAQFLQTRAFQIEDVCRWFHVPPTMVGAQDKQTSWGTGVEQQHIGYLVHAVLPKIKRLERLCSRLVADEFGPEFYFKLNFNGLLRGDMNARKEFYNAGIQNGWLTIDGVQELEDMNPSGLTAHYLPLNYGPIGTDGRPQGPDRPQSDRTPPGGGAQ